MSLQPPDHFLLPAEDHLLPVSSQILEEKLVAVQDSTVVRATLLKEKSNVNHELVIMEVLVCKASKTYTYIEADRKGEEDPGPKPRQRPSLNSSPSSSSTSFPSRSGEPPLAKDEIRIPRRGNRDYNIRIQQLKEKEETHDVLATITLHHKMTVTRLFIMLKILHDSSPYYDIFKYQCYWFAKTLMIMIGDEFDGFLSDDENSKQAGKFRSLQITTEMECMAAASGILKQCRTAWKKKEDRALQAAAPLQLVSHNNLPSTLTAEPQIG